MSEILEFDLLEELKKQGVIFNQHNTKGKNNGIVNNHFPKELKEQYKILINNLKDEVVFLRR